jgi:uncharacterized membrane protein
LGLLCHPRYETTMKTLLGYFWRGCLVLVPVVVTVYVAYFVVATFDRLVPVGIPGLGLVLVLVLVTLVGFMTSNVIGRAVVDAAERWLSSLPFLKLVYGSIRDLVQAFVGKKKRFDKPVALTLMPGSPIQVLGFVTRDTLGELGILDRVAVYVPQSYAITGCLLIAPRELVEPLDASSTDLMTFIVSGGVSGLGVDPGISQKPPTARTVLGLGPRQQK